MPNQPRTPHRTVRIPDDEWIAIKVRAAKDGVTATDVVREAVRRYLAVPSLALAVVLALATAGCGTTPAPQATEAVSVLAAAPQAVLAGSSQSCLSAARIAPPAWAGIKLSKDSAHRIGVEFNALTDDCVRAGESSGYAPNACLRAAQTMNLYKDRTRSLADIDAQYRSYWQDCVNG